MVTPCVVLKFIAVLTSNSYSARIEDILFSKYIFLSEALRECFLLKFWLSYSRAQRTSLEFSLEVLKSFFTRAIEAQVVKKLKIYEIFLAFLVR